MQQSQRRTLSEFNNDRKIRYLSYCLQKVLEYRCELHEIELHLKLRIQTLREKWNHRFKRQLKVPSTPSSIYIYTLSCLSVRLYSMNILCGTSHDPRKVLRTIKLK